MKPGSRTTVFKVRFAPAFVTAGLIFAGPPVLCLFAQDDNPTEPPAAASTNAPREASHPAAPPAEASVKTEIRPTPSHSAGMAEILKLVDAGVSTGVITAFIENSNQSYDPTAEDILALKARNADDEISVALLKRAATEKAGIANQAVRVVAMPKIVRDLSTPGRLDPESYEFWLYHYAYPRALSSSYRTLAPYHPRYSRGYSRPFFSGSRFSPPRLYLR